MTRALQLGLLGLWLAGCARNELDASAFSCPEFQSVCEGLCADTSTSDQHCGGCGLACDDNQECIASKCRPICADDDTLCASGCVDLDSDADNCGECSNECRGDARCINGACEAGECSGAQSLCGDECVDTQSNAEHCGDCFNECSGNLVCHRGACRADCAELTQCGSKCVDTQSDSDHCGNCITACAADEECQDAGCVPICTAGEVACGEFCVDPASDFFNCGECFNVCTLGEACREGSCTSCAMGMAECAGQCVDLSSDANNCGGCGVACTGICTQGQCAPVCAAGLSECGQSCVDLESNSQHCGACNVACMGACIGGSCIPDCDSVCDGMCVDVQTDPSNCGGCGIVCSAGQPCVDGFCALECVGETDFCGGRCVDYQIDPKNCGGCGIACPAGEVCSAGSCVLECPLPTIECDASCIDARFDPNHCGGCGVSCANGQVCSQGSCSGSVEGCDWTGRNFPYPLNLDISVGGVAVDHACNLYVAMQRSNAAMGGVVYSIDYQTQQVSQIAELARLARGVAYNPADATLYVTAHDRLVAMNTDGSNLRELPGSVAGEYLNGIALAPMGFGQYAGNLIVAQSSGSVLAFDPNDPVPVALASLGPFVSDVVFSGQRLFVAAFTASQLQEVDSGGMASIVAELPCEPEGLAADEAGQRLFVGCGRDDSIYSVDLSDGQPTLLPMTVDLNPGWAPLGMLYDNGALFVIEEVDGLRVFFP